MTGTGDRDGAELRVVSAQMRRAPAHADIDAETIDRLVEEFYGRIRRHARLGPIFEARLAGRWPEHLAIMKRFWSSVLLKTGSYKGQPVPVHQKLSEVVSEDFELWLGEFRQVCREIFSPGAARAVIEAGERIAQSLWFARFGFAGSEPPPALTETQNKEAV